MNDATAPALPQIEKPGVAGWLFNPFAYIAGGPSLVLGLAVILASGLIGSLSNSHFDGVLDFHTGTPMPLWFFVMEGFVDWLALSLLLFCAGKLISKSKFRAIDLFGTQAMARWPAIFSALLALLPSFQNFSRYLLWRATQHGSPVTVQPLDGAIFTIAICAMLLALGWMVWLMYRSFSVSCNTRGWQAVTAFIVSLLAAELISKVVIVMLA